MGDSLECPKCGKQCKRSQDRLSCEGCRKKTCFFCRSQLQDERHFRPLPLWGKSGHWCPERNNEAPRLSEPSLEEKMKAFSSWVVRYDKNVLDMQLKLTKQDIQRTRYPREDSTHGPLHLYEDGALAVWKHVVPDTVRSAILGMLEENRLSRGVMMKNMT